MTRFLTSDSLDTLLADLAQAGFEWKDENGDTRTPNPFEQTSNGKDSAIYLGHIPTDEEGTDDEGNPTFKLSATFHANVTACEGITFATEQTAPSKPYNVFA